MGEERRIRVAIAEDIDYLRQDIADVIAQAPGLELVGQASSGRQMVELAGRQQVDVVLMDIEMERYDSGIQAASEIAQFSQDTVFVFLTVHEDDELIYRAFSVAPNIDYIVKSAGYDQIISKIEDAYYGRIELSPEIRLKLTEEFGRLKKKESSLFYFLNVLMTITPSERELIGLLLEEQTLRQIARTRGVELSTIKSQVNTLLKKFHVGRSKDIVALIQILELKSLFVK